jgi:hypothetical protein
VWAEAVLISCPYTSNLALDGCFGIAQAHSPIATYEYNGLVEQT